MIVMPAAAELEQHRRELAVVAEVIVEDNGRCHAIDLSARRVTQRYKESVAAGR